MEKILIAVDDTKGARAAVSAFTRFCKSLSPVTVLLVHVEKLEGRSLMDEMLGEAELSTLQEAFQKTDLKELLDRRAEKIFTFYRQRLEENGLGNVRTVTRSGHPAEEILKVSREEGVDLIIVGARGSRSGHRFMGSVSREVADGAEVPVLLVRNRE